MDGLANFQGTVGGLKILLKKVAWAMFAEKRNFTQEERSFREKLKIDDNVLTLLNKSKFIDPAPKPWSQSQAVRMIALLFRFKRRNSLVPKTAVTLTVI